MYPWWSNGPRWPARAIPYPPGYTPYTTRPVPYTTPVSSGPRRRIMTVLWAQWANNGRVGRVRRSEAPPLFLYLRSMWPGSQSLPWSIQGKCWIDPGTLWPRPPSCFGPEMDCIWPPLSRFEPAFDRSGPCWIALRTPE